MNVDLPSSEISDAYEISQALAVGSPRTARSTTGHVGAQNVESQKQHAIICDATQSFASSAHLWAIFISATKGKIVRL